MVENQKLIITTQRTILRLINEDDLDDIAALNLDPEVRKFFPGGIQNREQTKQRMKEFMNFYKQYGLPCFVIIDKISNAFIGRCGFGPISSEDIEVGYLISRKYWGQGYASEVLQALLKWSKSNIKNEYIIAFAPLKHHAAHRVMEKCDMQFYKEDIGHGLECKFYRIENN